MASSGKKKTTFSKLAREHKLRERRLDKKAKKEARRQLSAEEALNPTPGLDEAEEPTQPVSDELTLPAAH